MPEKGQETSLVRDAGFDTGNGHSRAVAAPLPVGNNYLFVVAIDKYKPTFNKYGDLNNPINDAVRLINVLLDRFAFEADDKAPKDLRTSDPTRYGSEEKFPDPIPVYDGTFVKCLYNEEAIWANIEAHLDKICAQATGDDNMIFYFAGHGKVENDKGSIILHKGDDDDSNFGKQYGDLCFGLLDNYLANQKFRHVLYVFDCCHAGAYNLGNQGSLEKEEFSRYALVSCAANQKAADAARSNPNGSPFSLAMTKILATKGGQPFDIEDIVKQLESNLATQVKGEQTVSYGKMASKSNGSGAFKFRLKQQVQRNWTISTLKNTILDDLGFMEQKGRIITKYEAKKNALSIFSTCSESQNTLSVLGKILFRSASVKLDPEKETLLLQSPDVINLDTNITEIWDALLRQMEGSNDFSQPSEISAAQKKSIVEWMIGRLLSTEKTKSTLTIIIRGKMDSIKEDFLDWSKEFYQIFTATKTEKTQPNLGMDNSIVNNLAFLFEEVKDGARKLKDDIFENDEEFAEKINLLITNPAGKINQTEIDQWVKKVPQELNINKWKLLCLEQPDGDQPDHPLPECSFDHFELVKIIFEHMKFDSETAQKMETEIYKL